MVDWFLKGFFFCLGVVACLYILSWFIDLTVHIVES